MSDKPCPKCGKGCTACFNAGMSHVEPVVRDYEAWLGAALIALGVSDVFDIPDWKANLTRATVELREEAQAAAAAMRELDS